MAANVRHHSHREVVVHILLPALRFLAAAYKALHGPERNNQVSRPPQCFCGPMQFFFKVGCSWSRAYGSLAQ